MFYLLKVVLGIMCWQAVGLSGAGDIGAYVLTNKNKLYIWVISIIS